jgi:hypothetical protein
MGLVFIVVEYYFFFVIVICCWKLVQSEQGFKLFQVLGVYFQRASLESYLWCYEI